MKRREFIALSLGAVAWSRVAHAQQKLPTIGLLTAGTPESHGRWVASFVQRLGEFGWLEGRTIAIEYRWAEGRDERFNAIAAEFVRLKVDVIVTQGGAVTAIKRVTSVIPIVFTAASDPIAAGLVASLARPGTNATGLSLQLPDAATKRLELLREAVPALSRVAILANAGYPASILEMAEVEAAARTFGLASNKFEIRRAEDVIAAFERLKGRSDAVYVVADPLVTTNQIRINILAIGAQLPTIHGIREYVTTGGLMSYGASFPDLFRRAAGYVDKILRGAKPSDLPVEQPTKFDLVINLVAAKALNLSIPPSLLARADEVIE